MYIVSKIFIKIQKILRNVIKYNENFFQSDFAKIHKNLTEIYNKDRIPNTFDHQKKLYKTLKHDDDAVKNFNILAISLSVQYNYF